MVCMLCTDDEDVGTRAAVSPLPSPLDILGDPGAAAVLKKELETAGHTVNEEFNSRLATLAQRHRCKSFLLLVL